MAEKINQVCSNCAFWKMHGNKCWYHWEMKQVCTQKMEMPEIVEKNNVSRIIDS